VGRLGLGLGLVLVLRLGLGLALGLQLGIGIGFRRNHSWSSTFTPRRNHSLCHIIIVWLSRTQVCIYLFYCIIIECCVKYDKSGCAVTVENVDNTHKYSYSKGNYEKFGSFMDRNWEEGRYLV